MADMSRRQKNYRLDEDLCLDLEKEAALRKIPEQDLVARLLRFGLDAEQKISTRLRAELKTELRKRLEGLI